MTYKPPQADSPEFHTRTEMEEKKGTGAGAGVNIYLYNASTERRNGTAGERKCGRY